ncbi:MAG: hypothetical protein ACJ8HI_05040 [Massilia sp.]
MQLHHGLWRLGVWIAAAGFASAATAAAPSGDIASSGADSAACAGCARFAKRAAIEQSAKAPAPDGALADWRPVAPDALEAARGGFTVPGGLTVSLGIERMVAINGDVVARSSFDVADLNRMTEAQLRQTGEALSAAKLVQNGLQNVYKAGDPGAYQAAGIVVQNSLDNQSIRTETLISASVNSAALLNSLNFQGSLQDALTRSVAPH